MQNNGSFLYTEDQLMARLKFFIGVCLALTLTGIVFVVLYSLIFVTQPLNAISPIDQKFFELIVPIATFLTGTLSGIMLAGGTKEDKEAMLAAQKQATESFKSTIEAVKDPVKSDPITKTPQAFNSFTPNMNTAFAAPVNSFTNTSAANNPFGSQQFNPAPIQMTASGKKIIPDEEQPLI